MSKKIGRSQNIFPHSRLRDHMKNCGAEGFNSGVIELVEKALYEFLKEITEHAVSFTKHDGRKRIALNDLKQSLLYLYKDIYEKIV